MFAGDASGHIRTFCLIRQEERKPLYDKSLQNCAVNAIDIDEDGFLLLTAHSGGKVALWDLEKFSCVHVFSELKDVDA